MAMVKSAITSAIPRSSEHCRHSRHMRGPPSGIPEPHVGGEGVGLSRLIGNGLTRRQRDDDPPRRQPLGRRGKGRGGPGPLPVELIRGGASSSGIKFAAAADANEVASGANGEAAEDEWVVAPFVEALAPSVVVLARRKFLRGEAESAQSLRAIYVRPSDAELKG